MTRRQALGLFGGLMGFVLVSPVIVGEISGVGPEGRKLPARLARARALGLDPHLAARIARENARPAESRRAFDALERFLVAPGRFELPKRGFSPEGAQAARADLRRLGALSRAAQGGSHYDWAKGWALLFPAYAPIKGSAKVADALARSDADRGDWASATQNILDSADAWRAYGEDPITIAELVRCASLSVLARASGGLLARPGFPAAEARRLAAMAGGPDFAPHATIREILVGEVSAQVGMLDDPKTIQELASGGMTSPSQRDFEYGMKMPGVRRAWQSDALGLMNDAVARLPSDPDDYTGLKRVATEYERAVERPRGIVGRFSDVAGGGFYAGLVDAQLRREAQRRVLIVAAGLRAGESEARLRARLARLAIDPYDGRPIRVRPAREVPFWLLASGPGRPASEYRAVYSIGENGKDDGGRAGKKPAEGDLVLVIPR